MAKFNNQYFVDLNKELTAVQQTTSEQFTMTEKQVALYEWAQDERKKLESFDSMLLAALDVANSGQAINFDYDAFQQARHDVGRRLKDAEQILNQYAYYAYPE